MIATICLYALVSVSESVSVKFLVLYLVLKVSEKSGIGPPLHNISPLKFVRILSLTKMVSKYGSEEELFQVNNPLFCHIVYKLVG